MKIVIQGDNGDVKVANNLQSIVVNFEEFYLEGFYNETDSVVLMPLSNELVIIEEER